LTRINRVIRTYMKNMRGGLGCSGKAPGDGAEDGVPISGDGVKRMVFDRIGETMTPRFRRHHDNG
jgi:hypothetical protein